MMSGIQQPTQREQFIQAMLLPDYNKVKQLLGQGVDPHTIIEWRGRRLTAPAYATEVGDYGLLGILTNFDNRVGAALFSSALPQLSPMPAAKPAAKPIEKKSERFVNAVVSGDVNTLRQVMETFENVNYIIDESGSTALHVACRTGNAAMVEVLMTFPRLFLNIKDKQKKTAIDLAVEGKHGHVFLKMQGHAQFPALIAEHINRFLEQRYAPGIMLFKDCQSAIETAFARLRVNNDSAGMAFLASCFNFLKIDKFELAYRTGKKDDFEAYLKAGEIPPATTWRMVNYEVGGHPYTELLLKYDRNFNLVDANRISTTLSSVADRKNWKLVIDFISSHPTNAMDPYGYEFILTKAIKECNEEAVLACLAAKTPLNSLFQLSYFDVLRSKQGRGILAALLRATVGIPDLYRHIKLKSSSLPESVCSYLLDPLSKEELSDDVVIAPGGETYVRGPLIKALEREQVDPIRKTRLIPYDLRPNHDLKALLEYYRLHEGSNERIPLLINPATGKYYVDPVVAKDGYTYERSDLLTYLAAHFNYLPIRCAGKELIPQFEQDLLYPNLIFKKLISEVYLKREFLNHIQMRNYPAIKAMLAEGFSIDTPLDNDGSTAITFAITSDLRELFSICLEAHANVLVLDKHQISPIDYAQRKKNSTYLREMIDYLAIHRPRDFVQTFRRCAQRNNAEFVAPVIAKYAQKLKDELVGTIHVLIEENALDSLNAILEHFHDKEALAQLDTMLPDLIERNRHDLVYILLKHNLPMISLMTVKGTEVLGDIFKKRGQYAKMIEVLKAAVETRHPAIKFRFNDLLAPSTNNVPLSDEMEELLRDPIDFDTMVNPKMVPTGQSLSHHTISRVMKNPFVQGDDARLQPDQLRHNLVLADLISFYKQHGEEGNTPPMLYSLRSGKMFTKPVVDKKGITHERSEWEAHNDGLHPQRDLYQDTLLESICGRYAKKAKHASVIQFGLFNAPPQPVVQPPALAPVNSPK